MGFSSLFFGKGPKPDRMSDHEVQLGKSAAQRLRTFSRAGKSDDTLYSMADVNRSEMYKNQMRGGMAQAYADQPYAPEGRLQHNTKQNSVALGQAYSFADQAQLQRRGKLVDSAFGRSVALDSSLQSTAASRAGLAQQNAQAQAALDRAKGQATSAIVGNVAGQIASSKPVSNFFGNMFKSSSPAPVSTSTPVT